MSKSQLASPKLLYKFDRPREKLASKGARALPTEELIQVLLRTGTKQQNVAELATLVGKLVAEHGDKVSLADLQGLTGISLAKASTILAALELGRRVVQEDKFLQLTSVASVIPLLFDIAKSKQEQLVVFTLDGDSRLIEKRVVSVGTVNAALVHPREVFAGAISDNAASVIVAHNHPSGNPSPSEEDRQVTSNLREAGQILGIKLADHVIITPNHEYYSFAESLWL